VNGIDLRRVDLNLLVLFQAVLEERHVGRAADRMSLTPSAVSHGLGRLRRLLNDPLFLKTPKGVVPTARAAQLSVPIGDLLARARSVISASADASTGCGPISRNVLQPFWIARSMAEAKRTGCRTFLHQ
jgi:DNA-binding transcriptional LysR family regulator